MPPITRKAVECPTFGPPASLPLTKLPSNGDIYRYYQFVRLQLKTNIEPPASDILAKVSLDVADIWNRAWIPIVSEQQINHQVQALKDKYKKAIKNGPKDSEKLNPPASSLFDICSCKCEDPKQCQGGHQKVPAIEHDFLLDQRDSRQMEISHRIDMEKTTEHQKKMARKEKDKEQLAKQIVRQSQAQVDNCALGDSDFVTSDDSTSDVDDPSDEEFIVDEKTVKEKLNLEFFALECDRTQVSDAVGARLLNAALISLGIVDKSNACHVIDANRIRREREKVQQKLKAKVFDSCKNLEALYFDSRKDKTLIRSSPKASI